MAHTGLRILQRRYFHRWELQSTRSLCISSNECDKPVSARRFGILDLACFEKGRHKNTADCRRKVIWVPLRGRHFKCWDFRVSNVRFLCIVIRGGTQNVYLHDTSFTGRFHCMDVTRISNGSLLCYFLWGLFGTIFSFLVTLHLLRRRHDMIFSVDIVLISPSVSFVDYYCCCRKLALFSWSCAILMFTFLPKGDLLGVLSSPFVKLVLQFYFCIIESQDGSW